MTTATLPWFRQPHNAPGDFIVTWWVMRRNRRGTSALWPHSSRFENIEAAKQAASELGYAKKATVRRGADTLFEVAA